MFLKELERREYPEYYQTYINKLKEDQLLNLLRFQKEEMIQFLQKLSKEDLLYRYAPNKWSVAEVIQHLIDTERIFQYRALCIAREDKTSLPGYDHNAYVPASKANTRDVESFINEYKVVRDSGIALFQNFTREMLRETGVSNEQDLSAGAAGFIIAGHERHHLQLFEVNYNL